MKTRIIITGVAILVAALNLWVPDLKIDGITLALLLVAVAPCLAPVIKSVELPGGFKIELQDVKAATASPTAVTSSVQQSPAPGSPGNLDYLRELAETDATLLWSDCESNSNDASPPQLRHRPLIRDIVPRLRWPASWPAVGPYNPLLLPR